MHVITVILSLLISFQAFAGKDTAPPRGGLSEPQPFTVITSNRLRLSAWAEDEGSGVKAVRFFASFRSDSTFETKLLGTVTAPPYQMVWDCREIPDQNAGRLVLHCEIEDSAGNLFNDSSRVQNPYLAVDRNPALKENTLLSYFTPESITIDGRLEDWPAMEGIRFASHNAVSVYSLWNKEAIIFALEVKDRYLYGEKVLSRRYLFDNNQAYYLKLWENDCMEISFDMLHDHNIIRRLDDREVIISIDGIFQANQRDVTKKILNIWQKGIQCAVKVNGTLNDNADKDSGYTIELSIQWSALGRKGGAGDTMGFDVFNRDRMFKNSPEVWLSWSGVSVGNNDNPSEWGNLVLVRERPFKLTIAFILILVLVVIIIIYYLLKKYQTKNKPEEKIEITTRDQAAARRVKEYLDAHFHEEMGLSDAARTIQISKSKLKSLFAAQLNTSFSKYLQDLRMEKAEALLRTTDQFIIDVALKVGFTDPKYFSRVFKKKHGMTPQEYRDKNFTP